MDAGHDEEEVVPMRVGGIVVDPRSQVPVVVLRGLAEPRLYLPIFIGGLEATSIATVLADVDLPRPMTHDLMASLVRTLGSTVERITVTRLVEGTFYAEVTLVDAEDNVYHVDARPSDSIALALRVSAPIFVAREVIAEAGALADPETLEGAGEGGEGEVEAAAPPAPDAPTDLVEGDGPSALVDGQDVRLEDLEPGSFGKYKM
ncbi:MAG: bifunctional nuclease family protein [Deltaproteobacteria bacterium]|nr:bifunctional nuclease family protein [Deltaproteobacteria bacterium]